MYRDIMPHCQAKRKIYPEEKGGKIVRNVANYLTNKRRRRVQEDDNLQFDRDFVLS